jgi:tRNA(Ile)-lysidine synthase
MDDPLLNRVHAVLQEQGLWHPQALLVVAVSGGPDSLALLHILWRLQRAGGPRLHVAHLDHCFRGAQSAAEAVFVAETAQAWELPATVHTVDVPARVRQLRSNAQATARSVRYAFLADVARATGAAAVAVAHHADDQAETLLLHLVRGAGMTGLRGMRVYVPWSEWGGAGEVGSEPGLIRPLLDVTRAAISDYCAAQQLQPRDDPSNRSRAYTRNRIRAELLPLLASFNPQISTSLSRTAALLAADEAWIESYLATLWPELTRMHDQAIEFDRHALLAQHPALQRRFLRRAVALLDPPVEPSYAQIEQAGAVIAAGAGRQALLGPRIRLRVDAERVLLVAPAAMLQPDVPQLAVEEVPLPVEGSVALGQGWICRVGADRPIGVGAWSIALDGAALSGPLVLRRRRAGDRFRPAGGRGSRRLQDFFIDRKIAHSLRAAWPILATSAAIVWVCGLRADARFHVNPTSRRIVYVGFEKHDGEPCCISMPDP